MDFKPVFLDIMDKARYIALATSVGDAPNVRIVNCAWHDDCLYFSTFKGTTKLSEIGQNANVAFITLPTEGIQFVRVSKATAKTSVKTMDDLKDVFITKDPQMVHILASVPAGAWEVCEVHFTEADVTKDFGEMGQISL